MKRIIVQTSLMAVGVLVLAIGAQAQISQQYRAQIPFDFEAGGKMNAAGKYSLGPIASSDSPITLRSLATGHSRVLGVNSRGGSSNWDKPGKLVFLKANGIYRLSEVSTATFSMKVKRTRTDVREVAGGNASHEEAVTIYLN